MWFGVGRRSTDENSEYSDQENNNNATTNNNNNNNNNNDNTNINMNHRTQDLEPKLSCRHSCECRSKFEGNLLTKSNLSKHEKKLNLHGLCSNKCSIWKLQLRHLPISILTELKPVPELIQQQPQPQYETKQILQIESEAEKTATIVLSSNISSKRRRSSSSSSVSESPQSSFAIVDVHSLVCVDIENTNYDLILIPATGICYYLSVVLALNPRLLQERRENQVKYNQKMKYISIQKTINNK
jgi:hypothetical protein